MRFRLTYSGPLQATQRDAQATQRDPMALHKHSVRRVFHAQLKQLWATNKFLRDHKLAPYQVNNPNYRYLPTDGAVWGDSRDQYRPMADVLADVYARDGYRFVPLVREDISLICNLHILFLRRDYPGSLLSAGDLDNRIKTLIDCLRPPHGSNELAGNEVPLDGEDPFFVLLEDDKVVTGLTVETDTLLDPPEATPEADKRRVHLVITVELKPYDVTMFNLSFA